MSVIYVLLPLGLLLSASAVATFVWAARNGQLDDMDSPAVRILGEDQAVRTQAQSGDARPEP